MQDTYAYKRRYITLKRKCDSLELSNERVLNRLCHVKKYIHKLSRERRGLAKKLTELGDGFKKSDLTVPLEEELPGAMTGGSDSPSPSGPAVGETLGGFGPFTQGGPVKGEEMVTVVQEPPRPVVVQVKPRKKRTRDSNKPEREKDPNAPKKPANAFLMYCQQERQKVQDGEGNGIYSADMSHQDLTRQLAKQWKFLSEEEKKHYYLLYEKEKDRYDKAVKKYAKGAGLDKKKSSRDNGNDADSETIDVVKMGQEKEWRPKVFREEKITLKTSHTSEDQTIDVEKDEFEFTDPPGMAEEPKICLEKIDKSKLFDKARLFGLPSLDSQKHESSGSKADTGGKQLRDYFMKTEMRPLPRPQRTDFKGPAILEIATGRKSASPTMLSHAAPKMLPEAPLRHAMELSIKELVGARPSSFEVRNPAMIELKSKGEERTVLASALQNKPMFDMKMRSSTDYTTKHKPILDVTGPPSDASNPWGMMSSEVKSKLAVEMRSRVSAEQDKHKTLIDSNPRAFTDSKATLASELRSKPSNSETIKCASPLESKVRGSPETMRRVSLDNKRAVIELKKIPVDPSDDPYHFDD
ncbi:uncharacterized protein LOC115918167 [Strongylocentrotus purpuratus]|uniref:HMG box domain-containing protein n=1 Tax=Strongylocentrotus purpuratus TaxID=7668 RepID=A0A7M7NRQ5_STRPU|nr:uncharacterized protein LOC115918167 [Strongylocentrotus purpuratus]